MPPRANFRTLSASDFDPKTRGLRNRKVVVKSKSGCRPCKLKKVKVSCGPRIRDRGAGADGPVRRRNAALSQMPAKQETVLL